MTFADLEAFVKSPWAIFLLCLGLFCLVLGIVLRIACGASSGLSRSATTCLGIVFIYVFAFALEGANAHTNVLLHAFSDTTLSKTLPLIPILADYASIYVAFKTGFGALFTELVQMFTLAFMVDIMDGLLKKVIRSNFFLIWYFRACLVVLAAMVGNILVDLLLRQFLPGFLVDWLPALLFILIGVVAVLAFLGQILKRVAFFANPVLGALVSFFSMNPFGKTLVNAFLATIVLVLAVQILEILGLAGQIAAVGGFLGGCLAAMLVVVPIWYVVYCVLRKNN